MADESLQRRLALAHQARRAKEHQLDGIRRALCDIGVMHDDDPFGHADLEDAIRQWGVSNRETDASDPDAKRRCVASHCVEGQHIYDLGPADPAPEPPAAPCPDWSLEREHDAHQWDAPVDGWVKCPGWGPEPADGSDSDDSRRCPRCDCPDRLPQCDHCKTCPHATTKTAPSKPATSTQNQENQA